MQPEPFDFVIPRHCVPNGPDGLSPMQRLVMDAPEPVRVFSAPTGAGKSYAFRRAVSDRQARVLFIVPTRRLAQNLVGELIEELQTAGTTAEDAARRVVLWSSDEVARQKEADPHIRIGHLRVRQILNFEQGEAGDMIVATPESVVFFVVRRDKPSAYSSVGLADLVRMFDHIVFDEFHTIEARGFGLAAALALMTSQLPNGAKVTFLSATPIAIRPVLEQLGVPPEAIREEEEAVVTGPRSETGDARALHGDVKVRFVVAPTLADLLDQHREGAAATLAEGLQIVLVYDSVRALLAEKERLVELLKGLGVGPAEALALNSIDDSSTGPIDDTLFVRGHHHDPLKFRVLVATSTVEVGVTFRAGLMFLEPGFDEASLVQRIGRVARKDQTGMAVVRIDAESWPRKPWLRTIAKALHAATGEDGRLPIDRFMAVAMALSAARFRRGPEDDTDSPPRTFRSMAQRAIWCAGLFWHFLERSSLVRLGQKRTLEAFAPKQAKKIGATLADLEKVGSTAARNWVAQFREEALRMRVVPPRVKVIDPSGGTRKISFHEFERHPALACAPQTFDDRDDLLCVRIDCTLEEVFGEGNRQYIAPQTDALFPDRTGVAVLEGEDVAGAWLREAQRRLGEPDRTPQGEAALEKAIKLVNISRLVPGPAKKDARTVAGATGESKVQR